MDRKKLYDDLSMILLMTSPDDLFECKRVSILWVR